MVLGDMVGYPTCGGPLRPASIPGTDEVAWRCPGCGYRALQDDALLTHISGAYARPVTILYYRPNGSALEDAVLPMFLAQK